jgi:hypothetical protein
MRHFLFLVLPFLLGACQTNPFTETPDRLLLQVRTFEDVVRWGDLRKMYLFQRRDEAESVEIPDGLDNVRVTGFDAGPLNKVSETRWTLSAVIDYVMTDRQVVRQLVDHQVWVSDDEGKTWYRENPPPQFR